MGASWSEISSERLATNYRACRKVLKQEAGSNAALLAVIKADAYGHGAQLCAPVLARAGAEWLGVTDVTEGVSVREALRRAKMEHQPSILVMCGHLPEDAVAMAQHELTPVVWTVAQMEALADAARGEPLAVHLEIDSGMSRQGLTPDDLPSVLAWLAREPTLRVDGLLTHFASAERVGAEQTLGQRALFEGAVRCMVNANLSPAWLHAGNTSALNNGADGGTLPWLHQMAVQVGARPLARAGLGLYGYSLPLEGLVASDGAASRLARGLLPVMEWKTRILSLSHVEAGTRIGYNGSFVTERSMRLALLPVGYADGLRRELSSTNLKPGGWVMLHGRRASIVGRISMNLTTVDVTGIDAALGEQVTLLGQGITADDHAALANTIPYEILCGIRSRPELTSR